jgi:hypothetical protein
MDGGIFIPFNDLEKDPVLNGAVSAYVAARLRLPATPMGESNPDEEGLPELSVADAKRFLNNCGEKTTKVLRFIVAKQGRFNASDLHRHMKGDVRGVWTGLTRRLRSMTGDSDARLLNWFYNAGENEWRAVMARGMVTSFEAAFREHA